MTAPTSMRTATTLSGLCLCTIATERLPSYRRSELAAMAAGDLAAKCPELAVLLATATADAPTAAVARAILLTLETQFRTLDITLRGGFTAAADILHLYGSTQVRNEKFSQRALCCPAPPIVLTAATAQAVRLTMLMQPCRTSRASLCFCSALSRVFPLLPCAQVWFTAERSYKSFASPPVRLDEEMLRMHGVTYAPQDVPSGSGPSAAGGPLAGPAAGAAGPVRRGPGRPRRADADRQDTDESDDDEGFYDVVDDEEPGGSGAGAAAGRKGRPGAQGGSNRAGCVPAAVSFIFICSFLLVYSFIDALLPFRLSCKHLDVGRGFPCTFSRCVCARSNVFWPRIAFIFICTASAPFNALPAANPPALHAPQHIQSQRYDRRPAQREGSVEALRPLVHVGPAVGLVQADRLRPNG